MRGLKVVIVLFLLAGGLVVVPPLAGQPAAAQEAPDTLFIAKTDEAPSGAEIAVRLSEQTPLPEASRVVVARDDDFADALASGVMQSRAPLLLVDPAGMQPRVADHLASLAPAEVVLLGGTAAIPDEIEQQLRDDGYQVTRRQGPSRFETATAIAATDSPDATTAILVRAFPGQGATDPTQAFADSLAAGGLAAENGWPILLTQTEVLTGATRDHLAASAIDTVHIVGGTAAVSADVEAQLQAMDMAVTRIAGASRADTAVEIAKARGADTAADTARITLIDGQSPDAWAGGFAAAAHSAAFDAPIVLGTPDQLPAETQTFLAGAEGSAAAFAQAPADPEGIRLTCVIDADVCIQAREVLELPPLSQPPSQPGDLLVAGTCPGFSTALLSGDGSTVVYLAEEGCPHASVTGEQRSVVFVGTADGSAVEVVLEEAGSAELVDLTHDGDAVAAEVITDLATFARTSLVVTASPPEALALGESGDGPLLGDARPVFTRDGRVVIHQSCDDGTPVCPAFVDWRAGTSTANPSLCAALAAHYPQGSQGSSCGADAPTTGDGAFLYETGGPFEGSESSTDVQRGIARLTVATGEIEVRDIPETGNWSIQLLAADGNRMVLRGIGPESHRTMVLQYDPMAILLPISEEGVRGISADGSLLLHSAPARLVDVDSGQTTPVGPSEASGVAMDATGSQVLVRTTQGLQAVPGVPS